MDILEGTVRTITYTLEVDPLLPEEHIAYRVVFQLANCPVVFASASAIMIRSGDLLRVVGHLRRGVFYAQAYWNQSQQVRGGQEKIRSYGIMTSSLGIVALFLLSWVYQAGLSVWNAPLLLIGLALGSLTVGLVPFMRRHHRRVMDKVIGQCDELLAQCRTV